MSKKMTAFQDFFQEPVDFDGRYVIDAEGLNTEEDVVNAFSKYFEDWHWITDRRYLKNLIRRTNTHGWVKWHIGINEDGQAQNMWWLYTDYQQVMGRKGCKPVRIFNFDKHFVEFGHQYQPKIEEDGRARHGRFDCEVCEKLNSQVSAD